MGGADLPERIKKCSEHYKNSYTENSRHGDYENEGPDFVEERSGMGLQK